MLNLIAEGAPLKQPADNATNHPDRTDADVSVSGQAGLMRASMEREAG